MGDALNSVQMAAFRDELQKEAFNPLSSISGAMGRLGRGVMRSGLKARLRGKEQAHELLERVLHPREGLLKGWQSMSHRGQMAQDRALRLNMIRGMRERGLHGSEIRHLMGQDPKAELVQAVRGAQAAGKKPLFGAGGKAHLLEHQNAPIPIFGKGGTVAGPNRVQRTAEELSRRGWTGGGRVTKYLPVGGKGLTAGFSATAIPGVVNAKPATRTGEGGAYERALGEAGGTLGFVGGGGLGLVTGLGASMGLERAGSRIGRTLDRLRSGASLGEAWSAPSPTQAAEQLAKIRKHYG